jgi:hypothetical protein
MSVEAVAGKRPNRVRVLVGAAASVLALAVAVPLTMQLTRASTATPAHVPPRVSAAGLVQRSGVRVVRVAVTGDGGLLDLRYRVLDSEKADSVHDPATPPLLIDERTGGVLGRLLMGHTHSQRPKVGLTYYLIFENTGNIVRPGSRVMVQLGDARLADVPVQ